MNYYWYITKKDGERIRVRPNPESIALIKKRLSDGSGHIVTKHQTINVYDVKEFAESDEPVVEVKRLVGSGELLEEAARAFDEPLLNEAGDVISRAVKRQVTRKRWDSYFSKFPNYRVLEEGDSHVTMGYWLPAHHIDLHIHQVCNSDEIRLLTRA